MLNNKTLAYVLAGAFSLGAVGSIPELAANNNGATPEAKTETYHSFTEDSELLKKQAEELGKHK